MSPITLDIRRKTHGSRVLFENLHIELVAGEFVCLVGPSGSGKTTLLNLMAGLDRHYEGRIDLVSHHEKPRIGYVFQEPRLLPWCTVADNIALVLPENTDSHAIERLFEQVGLSQIQHLYPEQLSLGMSRRVALVRAFVINPDILLMDEPLVSLDPPTARKVRELLMQLWLDRPHTVFFVTHDLREAIELADRLIFLSASPSRICGDIRVSLPRSERNEAAIENFRKSLWHDLPEIRGVL